jgi:hypothetical protein
MSDDELEKRIRKLEEEALAKAQGSRWERMRAIRVAILGHPDILALHRKIAIAEGDGDTEGLPGLRKEAQEKFETFLKEFDAANPPGPE